MEFDSISSEALNGIPEVSLDGLQNGSLNNNGIPHYSLNGMINGPPESNGVPNGRMAGEMDMFDPMEEAWYGSENKINQKRIDLTMPADDPVGSNISI